MATLKIDSLSQSQTITEVVLSGAEILERLEIPDAVSTHYKREAKAWVREQLSDLNSAIENLGEFVQQMQTDLASTIPSDQLLELIKAIIGG